MNENISIAVTAATILEVDNNITQVLRVLGSNIHC